MIVSTGFNKDEGLVVVLVDLRGPGGNVVARLALDTGSEVTIVDGGVLASIGLHPTEGAQRIRITTGSGIETVPLVLVDSLKVLGVARRNFPVLAHTLPPSASIQGLLGLDFLRGYRLTVDLRRGMVGLS